MNDVLDHHSAWQGNAGLSATWANEMNFGTNHAPDARSLAQPVDLQFSMLPLCHVCNLLSNLPVICFFFEEGTKPNEPPVSTLYC